MLKVFRSRKMAALLLLGFSSGLPLYVTSRTLQAWMTVEHVNLSTIGLFSLVGLPYSLKFLWSPAVDRFSLPFLGRRKGWLAATQCALALSIAAMCFADPRTHFRILAFNALIVAFLSATQDITIDAYRADILEPFETGAGAGVFVLGYRVALIVTGSAALVLADHWDWPRVYVALGAAMFAAFLVSMRVREPVLAASPPATLREAIRMPFVEFITRQGLGKTGFILAFVVIYRLGDSMISNMTTPFLLQAGFTQSDLGTIQGAVGLGATIAGLLIGGAIIGSIGVNRSLWIFGVLQAVSNLAYLALAQSGRNYGLMVATIVVENVCTGLGTAALVGFLISLCSPQFSATQYALLSSLMAVGRDVLVAPSGALAASTGWPLFFLISFAAAIPGMLLLPAFAPWNRTEPSRAVLRNYSA